MRWLKGDLDGAIELMRMAAQAGSPRNHEAVAWAYTKLALYELQAGRERDAQVAADAALRLVPGYAAALLARAQVLFAADRAPEAVEPLREAAAENPLPEFQWALAEALRESGRADEAEHVECRLAERGAVEDPRTFALFLASRGRDPETAVRLAREELERRADVLTQDVLAWTLAAAGRPQEAREPMRYALAEGTRDARVFYHAGLIARMTGDEAGARRWLGQASHIRQMLLPSERERLAAELAAVQRGAPSARAGSRAPAARLASAPSGRP
jgi:tetratricopeptide (TPR) repeat protein